MTDTRLLGADFLRAAACLTVLFHHLAQRMSWNHNLGWVEPFRVFTQLGTFGVAMFFVLSGYLLARPFWLALDRGEEVPSLRTYAMRRAARILPGFWLALTITFILSVAVFGARLDGWLVLRYAAGFLGVSDWHWTTLFPVEVNGPLWSIGFEITSYVLLPFGLVALFLLRPFSGTGWQSRILWLGVIALAVLAHWLFVTFVRVDPIGRGWDYGLQGGAKFWMPRYNPFGFFAIFAIGALAAGIQVRLAKYRSLLFDAVVLGGFALALWSFSRQMLLRDDPNGFGWLGIPYDFPIFPLIVALILVAAPSSALIGAALDNPVSRFIARISFGIYIWHYIVLELARRYFVPDIDHGSMADPTRFVLTASAITAVTIIISMLSYWLIEAPAIRWARGRERGGDVASATLSPAAG
jgi:peptidoglycan/LPS O-acetylase OafA/YrhL